jgi:hypothetical protein
MNAQSYLQQHKAFAKTHPSYRYWCDAAATEIRAGREYMKKAKAK